MQSTLGRLRLINLAVLGLGAASALYFGAVASGHRGHLGWETLWLLMPYLPALGVALLPQRPVFAWLALAFCGLLAAFGAYAYYDTLYVHTDPQGGLVFLFIPIYQTAGAILGLLFLCLSRLLKAPAGSK